MTGRPPHRFETTQWTQVLAARGNSPAARDALRTLCETYYEPVAMFVRRACDRSHPLRIGNSNSSISNADDDSRDLTHEFFAKLLEGKSLDQADRARGRFRSYLLGAVKHFLADRHDHATAKKRGGGKVIQSLSSPNRAEQRSASDRFEPADPDGFPPDSFFDRQWGLTLIQQTIETLRAEAKSQEEIDRFEVLQRWLVTPSSHTTATEAAESLNLSEGAFKVAVHRLRKRFRQIVVERISATVEDPADVPEELDYLISAVTAFSDP